MGDTITQQTLLYSGSYSLFSVSSTMFPEPYGQRLYCRSINYDWLPHVVFLFWPVFGLLNDLCLLQKETSLVKGENFNIYPWL